MSDIRQEIPEDDPVEQDDFLEKTRAIFSSVPRQTWADHVAAEEEEMADKTARLRAARLARVMQ